MQKSWTTKPEKKTHYDYKTLFL